MLELRGGIFANGASTAAFVSLMNSAAQAAQTRYLKGKYVEVGEMQNISSEEGQSRLDQVKETLSDVEGIDQTKFVNKYALDTGNENPRLFDTFESYQEYKDKYGGSWVGGQTGQEQIGKTWIGAAKVGDVSTVYRNAVATDIKSYRFDAAGGFFDINASAGIESGIFVTGHELGHHGQVGNTLSGEIYANKAGANYLNHYRNRE